MEGVGIEYIVHSKLELEEILLPREILIADIYAIVADTKTDSPWLGNSDSGRQQDESQNNQCLSHIRPFQRNP
jgi:hypothetical protein